MSEYRSIKVVDPRMAREDQLSQVLMEGPASVTWMTITPANKSSKQPTWTIQVPSYQTGLGRNLRIRMDGVLTLTGTNLNGLCNAAQRIALRAFPIQSMCSSINLNINTSTSSLGNLGAYVAGLAALSFPSEAMAESASMFPCRPDTVCDYVDEAGAAGGIFSSGLGAWSNAGVNGRTQGITKLEVFDSGGGANTGLHVTFSISEALILPPCKYSSNSAAKYLFGVGTVLLNASYANYLRMLSIAKVTTVGSVTSITGCDLAISDQVIDVEFIAPSDASMLAVPKRSIIDYSFVQYFSIPVNGGAAGAQGLTFQSNAQEFNVIPSRIAVYVTWPESALTTTTDSFPDVCMRLNTLSVSLGIRSGLMSSASPVSLYEISRRGGIRAPYSVWHGEPICEGSSSAAAFKNFGGAPFVFDLARDGSLPDGLSPGMQSRISFTCSGTFTNQTAVDTTATGLRMVMLAIIPGYMESLAGSSSVAQGGVTPEMLKRAAPASQTQADVLHDAARENGISGGSVRMTGGNGWDDFVTGFTAPMKLAASIAGPLLGLGARPGKAKSALLGGRRLASDDY